MFNVSLLCLPYLYIINSLFVFPIVDWTAFISSFRITHAPSTVWPLFCRQPRSVQASGLTLPKFI